MADIVSSLFGLSPMDTQQQIDQEDMRNALAIANLPQGKRAAYTGQLLGAKLSRGLLGAFGVQDPRLQKATAIEESLKEVNDSLTEEEKANPALLYGRLADSLAAKGLQQEATMARVKAQESGLEYGVKQAQITKAEAEAAKALREKLGTFAQDLMASGIKPGSPEWISAFKDKIKKDTYIKDTDKRSTFAQVLLDAGYTEGSPDFIAEMRKYATSEIEGRRKGQGATISLGGINVDTGKVGEAAGKVIGENAAKVQGKYDAIDALDSALEKLDSGIYAGQYGKAGKFIAKATGGLVGDTARVQNTEIFLADVGNVVIPLLKEFGGNDSNEELKFLQGVVGGDTSLEPASIEQILKSAKKKIRNGIARLKKQTEVKDGKAPTLDVSPVDEPTATSTPSATLKWNPKTKKLEPVTR